MTELYRLLFPLTSPTPFLAIVGWCFVWSGLGTAVITVALRFGFRRGKGPEDL